ncbi:MAG: protein adenylyltransferase SelO [Acidimicrobiales bacterium]
MGAPDGPRFRFDSWFVRDLPELCERWHASPAPDPELLLLNDELAGELGIDAEALRTPAGVAVLVGNEVPEGAQPVAMAYAGHQFGGYSPRLGDGRALLLGEVLDEQGRRRDLHLKGSGRTPFARGGDGKAAVGPMVREYVISEAMHALGIPTTRGLAVVATGDQVRRETMLPGAVLARVAASHVRVGTFQYAAASGDPELVRRLADHVIARHHPQAVEAADPYLALLEEVVEAQASLVARWMLVGFVHGVMNTDNMTISGETIDYGPCAFLDAFDPATVFSSIDGGGRYAYGNQPRIALWNLARFAETLLPLIGDDDGVDAAVEAATAVLDSYLDRYRGHWLSGMRAKVGLAEDQPGDDELLDDLTAMLHEHRVDHTCFFRALSTHVAGDPDPLRRLFALPDAADRWLGRHGARLATEGRTCDQVAAAMDRVNPVYLPRNHRVEEALDAATAGNLGPVQQLVDVVSRPYEARAALEGYAEPAPASFGCYQTFCGT